VNRFVSVSCIVTAIFIVSFVALVGISRAGVTSRAPAKATPPSAPCDFQHRMDIMVIDGIWFECSCEALMVGTVCDWYEVTSPAHDPNEKVKRTAKHRRIIVHARIPAVVA